MMTLTISAKQKAKHYNRTDADLEAVVAEPESLELGNRAGTVLFRKQIDGRNVVAVTNWNRDTVITTYVPDDEWNRRSDDGIRLTPTRHAADRMRLMGLTLPEVERIVSSAETVDKDPKGNFRFRKYHDRRDVTVITDPARNVVITVFPADTIWAQIGGAPDVTPSDADPLTQAHEVITGLGQRIRALQADLEQAQNEAAALREVVEDYEAWLATAPRRPATAA